MILVFSMMAAIWLIGWAMSVPKGPRCLMEGVLLGAVILAHLLLPEGHALRSATGHSAAVWGLLLFGAGLIYLYAKGLNALKARARPLAVSEIIMADPTPTARRGRFSSDELARYGRHLLLRDIGGQGQKAIADAKVLVVGAGGLGSPVLQYLAGAGVGEITVIDDDIVEATNLQRQIIHRTQSLGADKVASAAEAMLAQNPHIKVIPLKARLTAENADALVARKTLVLDCCDSLESRYALNAACVAASVPLISAALTAWEGQLTVYDPARGAPCLCCVFPVKPAPDLAPSCAVAGVLSPLPGIFGTLMAAEAVKLLAGAGEALRGRMMIYDALYAETRTIRLKRDENCAVCGTSKAAAHEDRLPSA